MLSVKERVGLMVRINLGKDKVIDNSFDYALGKVLL